jgi:plastocyanin
MPETFSTTVETDCPETAGPNATTAVNANNPSMRTATSGEMVCGLLSLRMGTRFACLSAVMALLCGCSAPSEAPADVPVAAAASATVAIVAGTATPGAIVTLEPTAALELAPPADVKLMDQFGQQFLPDLLTVTVGQQVEFRSSEDVLHNVRVDHAETKEPIFNVATPSFSSYTHVFDKPGFYKVSCDVHPAMRANIFVAATPYTAVADKLGAFSIANVEPGSYTARAMSGAQTSEKSVAVVAPRTELSLQPLPGQ